MTSGVAYSSEEIERIKGEVIEWLIKTPMGTISEACSRANVPYSSFWDWRNKDPELNEMVVKAMKVAHEMGGDFAESKLRKKINDDDTASLLFYLKTKHKARGYVERVEQTGKDGLPIQTQSVAELTREELIEQAKERGLPTSIFEDNQP